MENLWIILLLIKLQFNVGNEKKFNDKMETADN